MYCDSTTCSKLCLERIIMLSPVKLTVKLNAYTSVRTWTFEMQAPHAEINCVSQYKQFQLHDSDEVDDDNHSLLICFKKKLDDDMRKAVREQTVYVSLQTWKFDVN